MKNRTDPLFSLRVQVSHILHDKVARLARKEFAKANPNPKFGKPFKPYSLPKEAAEIVRMLGQIGSADENQLNEFAAFAGSAAVLSRAY